MHGWKNNIFEMKRLNPQGFTDMKETLKNQYAYYDIVTLSA